MVGGVLYAKLGYNAVFVLALSVIALDVLLRLTLLERPETRKPTQAPTSRQDASGPNSPPAEVQTPVGPVVAALAEAQHNNAVSADQGAVTHAQNSPQLSAPAPRVAQTPPSRRRRQRLPAVVTLLASRRLLTALCGTLTVTAVASGLAATLPLHTAAVFGWRAAGSGLVFVPLAATSLLGPAVGRASAYYGPRWLVAGGLGLLAAAVALLRCVAHDTSAHLALLFALLVLVGCGCDLAMGPLMGESAQAAERGPQQQRQQQQQWGTTPGLAKADDDDAGDGDSAVAESDSSRRGGYGDGDDYCGGGGGNGEAYGGRIMPDDVTSAAVAPESGDAGRATYAQGFALNGMAYSLGSTVGPLFAGLVRDAAGWATMTAVLALFAALSAVLATFWTGGWIGERRKAKQRSMA